jgi:hypothetical protein
VAAPSSSTPTCGMASFPVDLNGKECMGLHQATVTPMGNPIKSQADCVSACCGAQDCETWNWCVGSSCAAMGGGCWIGKSDECNANGQWLGGNGRGLPPPPPPPPPALPGAPQNMTLAHTGLKPQPLPYKLGPNVNPQGTYQHARTHPFPTRITHGKGATFHLGLILF